LNISDYRHFSGNFFLDREFHEVRYRGDSPFARFALPPLFLRLRGSGSSISLSVFLRNSYELEAIAFLDLSVLRL